MNTGAMDVHPFTILACFPLLLLVLPSRVPWDTSLWRLLGNGLDGLFAVDGADRSKSRLRSMMVRMIRTR